MIDVGTAVNYIEYNNFTMANRAEQHKAWLRLLCMGEAKLKQLAITDSRALKAYKKLYK